MAFIIIPDIVKKYKKLNPNAKLLYGDILSLSQQSGYCFANNEYLANIYDFTERTISKLISELLEFGLIDIKNRTGDYGNGRAIVPLVTAENERTFQQGRTNVPRTNVLPTTNERSTHIERTFQEGRTIEHETTNKRSTIIDNIKDKEKIIVKDSSEKQVFAITPKKITAIVFPNSFSDSLKTTFNNYVNFRKEIKKSIKSDQSLNLLLSKIEKKLQKHSELQIIEVINLSIENGWQGLFFDKLDNPIKAKSQTKENIQDLEAFYLENYGPKYLELSKTSGQLERWQKQLSESFERLSELANGYKNKNISALFLFDLMYLKFGDGLNASSPNRKYECFEKIFAKWTEYQQNNGNTRELIKEHIKNNAL